MISDFNYFQNYQFDNYDNYGNLVKEHRLKSVFTSHIYGYPGCILPIAVFKNSINENKNSAVVGSEIKKEDDNFSLISSIITSHLESVFSVFVMNPVWSKSVILQVNFIIFVYFIMNCYLK